MSFHVPVAKRTRAQTRSCLGDRRRREETIVEEVDEDVEFLGETGLILDKGRNLSKGLVEAEDVISIGSVDSADLGNGDGMPVVGASGFLDSTEQPSSCGVSLDVWRRDSSHVDYDEGDVSSDKQVDDCTVSNSECTMCMKVEVPLRNTGAALFVQDGRIGGSSCSKCDSRKKENVTPLKIDEEQSYIEIIEVSDEMETSSSEDEMASSEDDDTDSKDEDYVGERSTSYVRTDNSSSSSEEEVGHGRVANECEMPEGESAFNGPREGKPTPDLKNRKASQCDITEEESASNRPRKGTPLPGLKKRKAFGLKILTNSFRDEDDSKESDVNVGEQRNCVALRTRSHFGRQGRDMMTVGTFSHPLCLDDDDNDEDDLGLSEKYCVKDGILINQDSHCEIDETFAAVSNYRKARSKSCLDQSMDDKDDDVFDSEKRNPEKLSFKFIKRKAGSNINNSAECPQKECMNDEDFPFLTKRKRVRSPKNYNVIKILVDSIWDNGEMTPEKEDAFRVAAREGETYRQSSERFLPLKFTFGEEESKQPEKSDNEKELDKMWEELDLCLQTCEIGSYNADQVGGE